MSVIDFELTDQQPLNGLFSFIGRKKQNATENSGTESLIDDIKNENGYNDLMYMKPEQAVRSLNEMLTQFAYHEAKNKADAGRYKTDNSKKQAQGRATMFSDASSEVMSQFRQYALGMDGELQKLGNSKKKIDGFEFSTPFYKLVLPQKAQNTTPVDAVSKDDLLSILQSQKNNAPAPVVEAKKYNMPLIIGGAIAGLTIIGGIIYLTKSK